MDNTINLAVCNVCGLIQANRIFAIFEAEGKTQIDFDNPELNLLLSEFSISKYKKDILENYFNYYYIIYRKVWNIYIK